MTTNSLSRDGIEQFKQIGQDLLDAMRAKDFPRVLAIYSPDATVYVAAKAQTFSLEDHFANAAKLVGKMKNLAYENVRLTATEVGYIQQHEVTGELPSGDRFRMGAAWVCKIENGRIVHHDFYVDSSLYV